MLQKCPLWYIIIRWQMDFLQFRPRFPLKYIVFFTDIGIKIRIGELCSIKIILKNSFLKSSVL